MAGDVTMPSFPPPARTPYPEPMMGWPAAEIDHTPDIDRFFELLNAHMTIAGARTFTLDELKQMKTGDLAKLIWPNGLNLVVYNKRFRDITKL